MSANQIRAIRKSLNLTQQQQLADRIGARSGKRLLGGKRELKRLCREEHGQGMVEYTLVMILVALVFWMGVRDVQVGDKLAQAWGRVLNCVTSPFSCSA